MSAELRVRIPKPHKAQAPFVNSTAKRIVVKAGRRGGKTKGFAIRSLKRFLQGRRQLYAAPTLDQVGAYWTVVTRALAPAIEAGIFIKNETEHTIELPGTEQRIKAKTAYNADTLRGDYADDLYLDEFQLMSEDSWDSVGAPMLADNDGDAVFGFTPPSLHSRSASKAKDKHHATKFYNAAKIKEAADPDRWATFHFRSHDNPKISAKAIAELAQDMTALAYRIEINAEDINQAPGALWTRDTCEDSRIIGPRPEFDRIVVAVDPSTSSTGNAAGIVGVGRADWKGYTLEDASIQGSPTTWGTAAVNLYNKLQADCIVAEGNQGGEMISTVIAGIDSNIKVKIVHASHGKAARAEPVAAFFEVTKEKPDRRGFLCGTFTDLEDELCLWQPGDGESPNRLDAMVWGFTELLIESGQRRESGVRDVGW